MKYMMIFGLLAVFLLLLLKRRRPQSDVQTLPPPQHTAAADAAAFRHWLAVLYRDQPQDVEAVYQGVAVELAAEGETDWQPDNIINFGTGELLDAERAFLVDWKDSESFIDWAAEMAARFGFQPVWTAQNQDEDLPETLMQAVYPQFLAHGAVLYNTATGGDYYCLAIVPQADSADFEAASQQWGLAVRTANQPY